MSFQQKLFKFFLTNTELAKPFLNKFVNGLGFGFGMGVAFQIQPRDQNPPPFVPPRTNTPNPLHIQPPPTLLTSPAPFTQYELKTPIFNKASFNPYINPVLNSN